MSEVFNSDDLENGPQCSICCCNYSANVNGKLPRRLPCSHLLCESCIIGPSIFDGVTKILKCPMCRRIHPAPRGARSFPQDREILEFVRRREAQTSREPPVCQRHGQEIASYCNECIESLCPQCYTYHGDHDVSDILQLKAETSRNVKVNAHNLVSKLDSHKQNLTGIVDDYEACYTRLDEEKRRYLEADRNKRRILDEGRSRILVEVDKVEETVNLLNNISQSYNPDTASYQNLVNRESAVNQISARVERTMAESSYLYFTPNDSDAEERYLEDTLTPQRYKICLDVVKSRNVVTLECQFDCVVIHHFTTTKRVVFGMTLLRDDSVMLWSGDGGLPNLVEYQLNTGREIWTERGGRGALFLPDRFTLAISYKCDGEIRFFNANDIRAPPQYFPSTDFSPTLMCLAQSGIMFVADWSNAVISIRRLDYNSYPPRLSEPLVIVNERDVLDMCFAKHGRKELIMLACGEEGMSAYNINNGTKEWHVKGELLGMEHTINVKGLTKEFGNLFASDFNNCCIHKFSIDSTHLGGVIKEGEHELGKPIGVRFKENPPSLVITHKKGDFWNVSVITITQPKSQFYHMISKLIYKLFVNIWPFGRNA